MTCIHLFGVTSLITQPWVPDRWRAKRDDTLIIEGVLATPVSFEERLVFGIEHRNQGRRETPTVWAGVAQTVQIRSDQLRQNTWVIEGEVLDVFWLGQRTSGRVFVFYLHL